MAINDEQNGRLDALEKTVAELKEAIVALTASDAMRADNPANDARNVWLDNVLAKYFANDKPAE